ncbi:MAG: hypothetical protein PHT69_03700 [Bacteroidales bacterium]|nr:hypothetical protein [Bacteroidales bacterium]
MLHFIKRFKLLSIIRYRYALLIFIFVGFLHLNCNKNDDPIPYVYVNFYVNLNLPQYVELTSVGGWLYVTGGFRGIVIYRKSVEEFMAFERACPYKPSLESERIEVESSGITAVDSSCGSRFLLIDGSVVNGPATISLKSYRTYLSGSTLQVTN